MIHPTAIISPKAQLDSTVEVLPFAVIAAHVSLGPGCRVGPHVYLTGHAAIGARNDFHAGCVIGDAPQDVKYKGEPAPVRIGDDNLFREGVTVHGSATPDQATVIGCHNFLMVNSHVGHNACLGSHIIIANGALLGGHTQVADGVFISGNCLVHQFVRLGALAFMQGGSALSQDLPPFTVACGANSICGLNIIGLRRAKYSAAERLELKRLYHALFRSGRNLSAAAAAARKEFTGASAVLMLDFIAAGRRGVCRHRGAAAAQPDID